MARKKLQTWWPKPFAGVALGGPKPKRKDQEVFLEQRPKEDSK